MRNKKDSSFKELIQYANPYIKFVILAVCCAVFGTAISLAGPDKLSEITDIITEGIMGKIDLDAVWNIGKLLIVLYAVSFVLNYLQGFVMATVTQKVSKNLRSDLSDKINHLPLKYFDTTSYGDVLSRVTNDIDTIGQSLNQSIGMLVTAITMLIGSFLMMMVTNVPMALTALAATLLGFVLMLFIVSRSQKYFIAQQRGLGDLNGHVEEIYSGHNVVKVYNGEKSAKEAFDKMNQEVKGNIWKSQFLSGLMMPIMGFIGNLGYVAVCVVGAALVLNGQISFGVIVAFMIYVRLFTQPLSQIAQASTMLQSAGAASKRVFEFLNEEELEKEDGKIEHIREATGEVEFEHVKFGYNEEKTIIKDFSVHVKPGQKVAIVGPTGAGKTTLVNLLMRFYEINDGCIKIDGVDTKKMTREAVHEQFCMVLQDTWMFEGTIRENIVYSKENVTDEMMVAACKAVGLDHFIRTLPKGYDSVLNESLNLSVGQKQMLTIARAMVEDAPLLILDEATSSVDTRTELVIQEAMDKLTEGRTSFVIAHRLSTIKNADLILVMKDGDIIESGKHDELLEKGGFYAQLYNSQFEQAS